MIDEILKVTTTALTIGILTLVFPAIWIGDIFLKLFFTFSALLAIIITFSKLDGDQ